MGVLEQLTALDILFMLLWLAVVVYGFTTGTGRQLFMIGSILVGMLLGGALAGPLSVWTGPMSGVGKEGILPFTWAVLVVLISLVAYVLVVRSYPNTKFLRMSALDSVAGGIVGFFTGLLLISELGAMIDLLTRGQWPLLDAARVNIQTQITSGPLFPWIADAFPLLSDGLRQLAPHV